MTALPTGGFAPPDPRRIFRDERRGGCWIFFPTAEIPAGGQDDAALIAAAGDLAGGETRIALRQGVEMGRPSRIGLTAVVSGGSLTEIRIAGRAVPVAQGRIRIPEGA